MPHHRWADACCCVCACCAEVALVLNGHGPVCVTGGEEELSEEERARRQVRVCVWGGGGVGVWWWLVMHLACQAARQPSPASAPSPLFPPQVRSLMQRGVAQRADDADAAGDEGSDMD